MRTWCEVRNFAPRLTPESEQVSDTQIWKIAKNCRSWSGLKILEQERS